MKKKAKRLFLNQFIFLICFSTEIPRAMAQGTVNGGGGLAVVCRDAAGKKIFVETLDLYEAKLNGFTLLEDTSMVANYQHFMKNWNAVIGLRTSDESADEIRRHIDNLFNFIRFTREGEVLAPSNDVRSLPSVPPGCKVEQLAYFDDRIGRIKIQSDLWSELSNQSKIGLVAHEIIYQNTRQICGERTSDRARVWVGALMSTTPPGFDAIDDLCQSTNLEYVPIVDDSSHYFCELGQHLYQMPYRVLGKVRQNYSLWYMVGSKQDLTPMPDYFLGTESAPWVEKGENSFASSVIMTGGAKSNFKRHQLEVECKAPGVNCVINFSEVSRDDGRFSPLRNECRLVSSGLLEGHSLSAIFSGRYRFETPGMIAKFNGKEILILAETTRVPVPNGVMSEYFEPSLLDTYGSSISSDLTVNRRSYSDLSDRREWSVGIEGDLRLIGERDGRLLKGQYFNRSAFGEGAIGTFEIRISD